MARTGADVVIEALQREGVDLIFGYPGGAILDVFDRLYLAGDAFRFVLTRHEQGATHMADGYARVTGRPGVVVVTSGPGATNTVTGIATAYMDSVPMVVITGQVPSSMIGNDAFQEADVTGITRPITKHNYLVKDVDDLPGVLKEAFYVAASGRPGPVLVDIPKDIQKKACTTPYPASISMPTYRPTYEGNLNQIRKAADAIKASARPLIYAGGGVIISNAADELRAFIRKTHIPITTTLMGLGAYPDNEPESLKVLGMHGTKYANYAIQNCDLLIAVGARFDDRVTGKTSEFAPKATVIHIDIDPSSISKNVLAHVPVVGDVKDVLKKLTDLVQPPDISAWTAQVAEWKRKYPLAENGGDGKGIPAQQVMRAIDRISAGEAIVATDVGQHQMWAMQYITCTRPRSFISSGGLGTMGFGLPAAIGAQLALPDRTVFCVSGDGGFQMNAQELTTAAINNVPVVAVIFNNAYLGMVRQWQELFYDGHYSMACLNRDINCPATCTNRKGSTGSKSTCPPYRPDFVKLAEAHGCFAQRVTKTDEVEPALRNAVKVAHEKKQPAVIECITAREDNVFPMVPAGKSLDEMVDSLV